METKQLKRNSERYNQIKRATRSGGMLDVPEELRAELKGYYLRWPTDEKPNRLEQMVELGYEPVKDKKGKAVKRYGGVSVRGKEYSHHLMKISLEGKKEIDFVKETERGVAREANIASAFTGLNPNELYQKDGMGDLSSLENIKSIKKL